MTKPRIKRFFGGWLCFGDGEQSWVNSSPRDAYESWKIKRHFNRKQKQEIIFY